MKDSQIKIVGLGRAKIKKVDSLHNRIDMSWPRLSDPIEEETPTIIGLRCSECHSPIEGTIVSPEISGNYTEIKIDLCETCMAEGGLHDGKRGRLKDLLALLAASTDRVELKNILEEMEEIIN